MSPRQTAGYLALLYDLDCEARAGNLSVSTLGARGSGNDIKRQYAAWGEEAD